MQRIEENISSFTSDDTVTYYNVWYSWTSLTRCIATVWKYQNLSGTVVDPSRQVMSRWASMVQIFTKWFS
jgi:hypothetical protein